MNVRIVKRQQGFSLIELMITVSIVGILMAVGIPSYQAQVKRGLRSDAQVTLQEIASKQEQFMMIRQTYSDQLGPTGLNYVPDTGVSENYSFSIALTAGPPEGYIITATAIGDQSSDGDLTLSSDGTKTPADKW